MENLIKCDRCGSNACLHEHNNDTNTDNWFCFGCGFTTSSELLVDSELLGKVVETLPDLYKDLLFVYDNKVWVPCTIAIQEQGIVFVDGTSVDDWSWASAVSIPIPDEELSRFPEGQKHKIDFSSIKHYGQRDFMEALDYIGFFKIQE